MILGAVSHSIHARPLATWPEEHVTLIAAWQRDGYVLVAADTAATSSSTRAIASKAWRVGVKTLMWGYAGPEVYGKLLTPHMNDALPNTWTELEARVGSLTRAANAQARTHAQAAGITNVPPENLITVLVAGFLEDRTGIIEAHPSGLTGQSSTSVAFIGAGLFATGAAEYAYLAEMVASRLAATDEERLRVVMESVANWQVSKQKLGIGEPIEYWRVTPNGVDQFEP